METESKNFLTSLSFWGVLASFAVPVLASKGIVVDAGTLGALLAQLAVACVGLYGVLRRKDIHVVPKKR